MSVASCGAAGASVVSPAGGADRLGSRSGHPIKARMTRRTMRQLRLHWTSMPKGSPDDNPAETIFSDIQQNILDNSDDPDERAIKGRISNHLQARNIWRRRGATRIRSGRSPGRSFYESG